MNKLKYKDQNLYCENCGAWLASNVVAVVCEIKCHHCKHLNKYRIISQKGISENPEMIKMLKA